MTYDDGLNIDIDTRKLITVVPSPIVKLIPHAKRIHLVTFSFSFDSICELNKAHKRGADVQVVFNKFTHGAGKGDCSFRTVHNGKVHAKIWVIDKDVYVGSANLTGDTIINLTVCITDKGQRASIRNFVDGLLNRQQLSVRNYVL